MSSEAHRSLDARDVQGGEAYLWQKAHIHQFVLAAKKKSFRFLRLRLSALLNAKFTHSQYLEPLLGLCCCRYPLVILAIDFGLGVLRWLTISYSRAPWATRFSKSLSRATLWATA